MKTMQTSTLRQGAHEAEDWKQAPIADAELALEEAVRRYGTASPETLEAANAVLQLSFDELLPDEALPLYAREDFCGEDL